MVKKCAKMGDSSEEEMTAMMEELGTIQDLLMAHDFYIIDSKVEEIGRAFGLDEIGLDKDVDELSGGQRTKVLLGKLLLEKRHPVLKRYLEREIRIRTDILKSIEKKDSQKIQVRKRQLEEELNIAEKGMEYYAL